MTDLRMDSRSKRVFINCPFDDEFKPIFDAIVFAIHDLGFEARHALIKDGNEIRLLRIAREIAESKYSIHDLSRVEVSGKQKLPRFNMPFEAGIAFSLSHFATESKPHHLLLLDSKRYRYQATLSDVAGLDPKIHDANPEKAIESVRNFLSEKTKTLSMPGGEHVLQRYGLFLARLPNAARVHKLSMKELQSWSYVNDLQSLMSNWILTYKP